MIDEAEDEQDLDDDSAPEDDGDDAKIAEERAQVVADSLAGKSDTLIRKVGLLLNRYTETRDSDLALQIKYWRVFQGWNGLATEADLYRLARFPSIARCRARIQNTLKLFQASPGVRKRRGTLEEEERERAVAEGIPPSALAVFADESGKNQDHLIVGGIWFADSRELFDLDHIVAKWRQDMKIEGELHFVDINDQNEPVYRSAFDTVINNASSISFKAHRLERRGIRDIDAALDDLFYFMLVDGVRHEHHTGRSLLPKTLQFWKDQEDPNRDKLRLAKIQDRVRQAGKTIFDGKLRVGDFVAVESHHVDMMQIADLFIGALGRRINTPSATPKAKDRFSKYVLDKVGLPDGPTKPSGDFALDTVLGAAHKAVEAVGRPQTAARC